MKKIFFITTLFLTFAAGYGFCQNRSIQFVEMPWAELKEKALKENKMIFLDAYATWCGPCKWMAANMFTNDTIADFFNGSFLCTKFDMEKGEGVTLRQQYQVSAYPTLLFIDGNGNLLHKKVGAYRSVADYIRMGKIALDPEERYAAYVKNYAEGKIPPDRMYTYFERMSDAYQPVREQVTAYFRSVPEKEMTTPRNWEILFAFVDDLQSREGRYLVMHAGDYAKLYTEDSVFQKVSALFLGQFRTLMKSQKVDTTGYENIKTGFRELGYPRTADILAATDLSFAYLLNNKGDKEGALNYAKAALQSAKAAGLPVEKYEEAVKTLGPPVK